MPMQILHRFSGVFRNKLAIDIRRTHSETRMSPRELTGEWERQLYSMGVQEQSILRHILKMAGDTVPVHGDTFATDKNNNSYYIEKGQKVRISEDPLTFERQGDARINIFDKSDNSLSMRLSDYIQDIYVNH